MIIKNKFDKPFGPFATSTGFFLFLGGITATFFSIIGLFIAIAGAFVAFTSTWTLIDIENKRIKHSDNLFGFISAGKWIHIKPGMKIGLKKQHRGYRAYIMGTQPVGIHFNDIVIYLFDNDNKQIIPVKKSKSFESAKKELHELSTTLEIDII